MLPIPLRPFTAEEEKKMMESFSDTATPEDELLLATGAFDEYSDDDSDDAKEKTAPVKPL